MSRNHSRKQGKGFSARTQAQAAKPKVQATAPTVEKPKPKPTQPPIEINVGYRDKEGTIQAIDTISVPFDKAGEIIEQGLKQNPVQKFVNAIKNVCKQIFRFFVKPKQQQEQPQ